MQSFSRNSHHLHPFVKMCLLAKGLFPSGLLTVNIPSQKKAGSLDSHLKFQSLRASCMQFFPNCWWPESAEIFESIGQAIEKGSHLCGYGNPSSMLGDDFTVCLL